MAELAKAIVSAARDVLRGSTDENTHLKSLAACAAWVQRHYTAVRREMRNEGLPELLSHLDSSLELGALTLRRLRRKTSD